MRRFISASTAVSADAMPQHDAAKDVLLLRK
jgi:hypothetical protein